jgi:hypothetical protein
MTTKSALAGGVVFCAMAGPANMDAQQIAAIKNLFIIPSC